MTRESQFLEGEYMWPLAKEIMCDKRFSPTGVYETYCVQNATHTFNAKWGPLH